MIIEVSSTIMKKAAPVASTAIVSLGRRPDTHCDGVNW
jgi:hypothetical protein